MAKVFIAMDPNGNQVLSLAEVHKYMEETVWPQTLDLPPPCVNSLPVSVRWHRAEWSTTSRRPSPLAERR